MLAVDNGATFTVTVSELPASEEVHPAATITLNSFDTLSLLALAGLAARRRRH